MHVRCPVYLHIVNFSIVDLIHQLHVCAAACYGGAVSSKNKVAELGRSQVSRFYSKDKADRIHEVGLACAIWANDCLERRKRSNDLAPSVAFEVFDFELLQPTHGIAERWAHVSKPSSPVPSVAQVGQLPTSSVDRVRECASHGNTSIEMEMRLIACRQFRLPSETVLFLVLPHYLSTRGFKRSQISFRHPHLPFPQVSTSPPHSN